MREVGAFEAERAPGPLPNLAGKAVGPSASVRSIIKRLVIDLDGTLTRPDGASYADVSPNLEVLAQLRAYKALGFEIVIHTSRNMRTHNNSVGKIIAHTVPIILRWLERHDVPFDEIVVGKPWCGTEGFYVDDRALRPDEFARLSLREVHALLGMNSDDQRLT